ncbi:MAG: hypothetical protein D6820_07010 [Lentisphaerae bacterium]|nr:MAG: hypothetical protein D6820_07010 [Lentisphaerota bacterium]
MADDKKASGKDKNAPPKKPTPFRNGLILGVVLGIVIGCFIGTPSFLEPYRSVVFGQAQEAKRQALKKTGETFIETGKTLQEKADDDNKQQPNRNTQKK